MPERYVRQVFLASAEVSSFDRTLALWTLGISIVVFAVSVPFAKLPLAQVPAFVASYQSALAVCDLITAVLLAVQFRASQSRGLLVLAGGYLFTAFVAVIHALTFPGLFAPSGLLGSGSQTTVWLYMLWHGGFPLAVVSYALLKDNKVKDSSGGTTALTALMVLALAVAVALATTLGHDVLPILLFQGRYTPTMIAVVSFVWSLSLGALVLLWFRRPRSVLDLWLMVVLCAWLFDIALSAVLNEARFDLGFYVGRIYGLLAASFVLIVLLFQTGTMQIQLTRLLAAAGQIAETERHQHAQRLDEEIEERRRIFETSQDLILVTDTRGNFVQVSPSSMTILGYQPDEMIGHTAIEFIFPDDLESTRNEMRLARRGQQTRHFKSRYVHKDGRIVSLTWMGVWSEPVRRHFFMGRDMTEQIAAEERFRQAQKMEAVGQLTGGIAHDFNNILTVITGTIEILADAVADKPQLAAIAKMIDEAADRGAELTRHLLAFARKQPLQPRETDVNQLLLEASQLLRPTLGERIEIEAMLDETTSRALVDPNQLTTAILNLALNARDAMDGGGKLTLETRNVALDESYAAAHSEVTAGPYVLIAVSDTGSGIPANLLDKVVEPFFTTKEVGKGTGLGLSMVYGFVKQSNGHIKIYSEEGHGTSVKIYLPPAVAGSLSAPAPEPEKLQGGHELVLVVEDDPLVRNYVVAQVQSLGYTTLSASNAAEAMSVLDNVGSIDLLFTDVIMPGAMNGRQLAEAAVKKRPELAVLYTSGYTENAIVHHGRLDSGVLLLAKPYRKADLARMLRLALLTAKEVA